MTNAEHSADAATTPARRMEKFMQALRRAPTRRVTAHREKRRGCMLAVAHFADVKNLRRVGDSSRKPVLPANRRARLSDRPVSYREAGRDRQDCVKIHWSRHARQQTRRRNDG